MMTSRRLTPPIVSGLLLCTVVAAAAPAAFFVAPGGADTNAGTKDRPFASFERARDAARALRAAGPLPTGGVVINIRAGRYELRQPLVLEAQDGGTPKAPIVYRGYAGERPVLMGGQTVRGWRPYRAKVLQADLAARGAAPPSFRQLLCNGERMQLARYPNYDPSHYVTGGWAYVDGTPVPMYAAIADEREDILRCRPADLRSWARPQEGEVMVFPRYNWWNNLIAIKSVEPEQHTITLAGKASYGIRPGDRYFVRGLFEELDAPGEWYLDRGTSTLYFWPPEGVDPARMSVCAPTLRTLLELRPGVANVTFRGLVFEACEGTAVTLTDTTDCLIAQSTIHHVGDYNGSGVSISGGKRNGVAGCDLYEIGCNGVVLAGGNAETLEPAGNYADNNYLHHLGVFYKQGVGVSLGGVGNRASHNLIHDCPRFGISWGGNDHRIEYNHIRHVNLETADCGAIYSWQVDWVRRGTQIRYNYLHDVIGFGLERGQWTSPHFNWGIYLDDGTCGTHVYGNLIVRTILGGVHVHGGRDNVIENNILIDGRDNQLQYSGYVAGGHPVPMMTDTWNKFHGTPAYARYPGYLELTRSLEQAWQMAGNRFVRNIVCYREPAATLYAHANLPFDKTVSDYNLVWHYGAPVRTGVTAVKLLRGPNLAPNPDFDEGEAGQVPPGWHWQVRPNDSAAALDDKERDAGRLALRLEARGTVTDSSGQTLCSNFVSEALKLQPGLTYRLSARVKAAPGTGFSLMAQAYEPGKYFWARPRSVKTTGDWQSVDTVFRFPAPADADWHEGMGKACLRLDVQGTGTVWVDSVELREAVAASEWEAWQGQGLDRHSLVADPLFLDSRKDNYRLRPGSPALKLGFKPLPIDSMGPYRDELRVSWPIVEAEGAREQMKLDWSRH